MGIIVDIALIHKNHWNQGVIHEEKQENGPSTPNRRVGQRDIAHLP